MKKTSMKRVKGDGDFGFEHWSLDTKTEFKALIKKLVGEGVRLAANEYPCFVCMVGSKPGEFHVELPLGEHEDTGPTWTFDLDEVVTNFIAFEDDSKRLKQFREVLIKLIPKLDSAIAKL